MPDLRPAAATLTLAAALLFAAAVPAEASVESYAWLHRPGHWPSVYVEDHTGNDPAWNVRHAVHRWGSGLHYGPCRAGAGCIRVYERHQGTNGWVATSWWRTHGPRLLYVRIGLNETYLDNGRSVTRQAVVHELGHGLGLDHDPYGVMQPVDHGGARITAYERRELHSIYGVPG